MSTIALIRERTGSSILLERELSAGGEGRIYAVAGEHNIVAKIYHQPTLERAAKLQAMLANPPTDPTRQQGHVSIAWPTDRVLDTQSHCIGFLMPYIDFANSIPLLKLYHPADRQQTAPDFTWKYLLRTASNLASALEAIHTGSYIIGDVNESNVLVSTSALATLVDCDSIQVPKGNGQTFRCTVGKPDYTPPELQGLNFSQVDRAPTHDDFGLAVLIFLLLMEGVHPFDGVWHGGGIDPTREQRIRAGNWPYDGNNSRVVTPPPMALPFLTLPPRIQVLMKRCFSEGFHNPSLRPTAHEWRLVLAEVEQHLACCRVNSHHWYSQHLSACPWCTRVHQLKIADPFPLPGQQAALPPVANISQARTPFTQPLPNAGIGTSRPLGPTAWQAPMVRPGGYMPTYPAPVMQRYAPPMPVPRRQEHVLLRKKTILIVSIVAVALIILGSAVSSSVVLGLAEIPALAAWILGLVKTAKVRRWGWFISIAFFNAFATLLYGMFGPE